MAKLAEFENYDTSTDGARTRLLTRIAHVQRRLGRIVSPDVHIMEEKQKVLSRCERIVNELGPARTVAFEVVSVQERSLLNCDNIPDNLGDPSIYQ